MKRLQTNNLNTHYIKAWELPFNDYDQRTIKLRENGVYVFDLGKNTANATETANRWREGLEINIETKLAPIYIDGKDSEGIPESGLLYMCPDIVFNDSFVKAVGFNDAYTFINQLYSYSSASMGKENGGKLPCSWVGFGLSDLVNATDNKLKMYLFTVIVTDYTTYITYQMEI